VKAVPGNKPRKNKHGTPKVRELDGLEDYFSDFMFVVMFRFKICSFSVGIFVEC